MDNQFGILYKKVREIDSTVIGSNGLRDVSNKILYLNRHQKKYTSYDGDCLYESFQFIWCGECKRKKC